MASRLHLLMTFAALSGCKTLLGIDEGVVGNTKVDGAIDGTGDALLDAPIDSAVAWWDPAFPSRRSITIATTNLTLPIADFPLLVRIPADVKAELVTGGADIRFVDTDNVRVLPYELEADTTEMVCWVKLSLTTQDQRFWLYYGNMNTTTTSNSGLVFSDFVSVHHLASVADATNNDHVLSAVGSGNPGAVAATIGRGSLFDGNDFYAVQTSDGPYDFTGDMSASMWFRISGFTIDYEPIITKGDTSWRIQREGTSNNITFASGVNSTTDNVVSTTNVANNVWHHVLVTREAQTKQLFLDGVLEGMHTNTPAITTNNNNVRIGGNDDIVARFWGGSLDEVRVSATPRSAAWAKAEYLMASPSFTTFGAREMHP